MTLRIRKYPKGWVVEKQCRKWYGKTYWTHFTSVAGIESMPWYYSSKENAERDTLDIIKWQLRTN